MDDHVLSIDIKVPVQKAWDEITKTGRIQKALYNTILESELTPGSKLRYYTPDRKRVFVVGEVIEVEPPTKFVHTYVMTMRPDPPTVVTWQIEEIPGGCRVSITHSGWTEEAKTYKNTGEGWKEILGLLKHDLETGDIPFKNRVIYKMMTAFMFTMPKSTKTEEVDKAGW